MKKLLIGFAFISFSSLCFAQNTGQQVEDILKAMSSGKKVPIKSEYNFSGSATFETKSTYKGKPMNGSQKWYFPTNNEQIFGMEMTFADNKGRPMTNKSIIDFTNKSMIMLMDEQKMAMSIPLDIEKTAAEIQKDPKWKTSPPKKTGKTKTILGYSCDEWMMVSDEHSTSVWITEKMPFYSVSLYKAMQQQMYKNGRIMMPNDMKGMVMEMIITDKKDNSTYTMTCTGISDSATKISTAGYQKM